MTDQNEFSAFLEGAAIPNRSNVPVETASRPLYVEVPPLPPPKIEKASAGYAPMERIALEGQAYRGLASGSQPWWVIITGWVIFGVPCVSVLVVTASLFSLGGGMAVLAMLGAIALCTVYLWIMYRGTKAKLAHQREQQQRRAKYQRELRE